MSDGATSGRVVYVATGSPYIQVAALSIVSLRRFFAGPVTLLGIEPLPPRLRKYLENRQVDVVQVDVGTKHTWLASRHLKTQLPLYCTDKVCLFIDADTMVRAAVDQLWTYVTDDKPLALTRADFATMAALGNVVHMRRADFSADYRCTLKRTGPGWPYYSSTTMVWRRTPQLLKLFTTWHDEFERFKSCDMLPLTRAIHGTGMPIVQLPSTYNVRNHWKKKAKLYTERYPKLLLRFSKMFPREFAVIKGALQ